MKDMIKEKIEETRNKLDYMIENEKDSKKILEVSMELDRLIEEYMSLDQSYIEKDEI